MKSTLLVLACCTFSLLAQNAPEPRPARPVADASDPEVVAWVTQLTEKLAHPNEVIRASAQDALARLGAAAVPQLKALAEVKDGASSKSAKDVLTRIEQRRAGGVDAERRGPGAPQVDAFLAALKAANPTPEQETKIRAAFDEQKKSIQELYAQRMNGALTKEEAHAAMRALEVEVGKTLRGILDETQFESFMEAMRKSRGPARRKPDGDK